MTCANQESTLRPSPELLNHLMGEALKEATKAAQQNEVPVGAVIAQGDRIISRACNLTEQSNDPTAHAEILAIRAACAVLGNWRLADCILCVTLEPCTMCTGAIRETRLPLIAFGTPDERAGALGSLYDLSTQKALGSIPRVVQGIRGQECKSALREFFGRIRSS